MTISLKHPALTNLGTAGTAKNSVQANGYLGKEIAFRANNYHLEGDNTNKYPCYSSGG
jgi:hypothetical protein